MAKRSHGSKTQRPRKKSSKTTNRRGPTKKSGYLIFCGEQRAKRQHDFSQMPPKEIMKLLGSEWRQLSPEQKQNYQSKASAHSAGHKSESHSGTHKSESHSTKSQSHKSTAHHQPEGKNQSTSKKRTEQSASRSRAAAAAAQHTDEDSTS